MTVSQELREWAASSGAELWFADLSHEALIELRVVGIASHWDMVRMGYSDRRTFALLVACALEDE